MITEIKMCDVASFKAPTSLITDKKINLIYGLNGTGKSTISNFLLNTSNPRFSKCTINPEVKSTILVYNQAFIKENFHITDKLKGIFSLSKENKAAEQKIVEAEKRLIKLQADLAEKNNNKAQAEREFTSQKQVAIDNAWKIKGEYSGGDRVLEYCLEGLKGQKEKLFEHLLSIPKPLKEPAKTDADLKKEVGSFKGDGAQAYSSLDILLFTQNETESDPIFSQPIVGNEDSVVAGLIEKLGNSDWVREGLEYLPETAEDGGSLCPFCQEKTITDSLVKHISSYFDDSYQETINKLQILEKNYREAISTIPNREVFLNHPYVTESKSILETLHDNCIRLLNSNLTKISQKIKNPRTEQMLENSTDVIAQFNKAITTINVLIDDHNSKVKNMSATLAAIKEEFWALMRWKYDQTIDRLQQDAANSKIKTTAIQAEIGVISDAITAERNAIAVAQKETVNIDEAITNINISLSDLAIEDFVIKKHSENLYRVVRPGDTNDTFHTLSEGERMIISFLYFCELCKGRVDAEDTNPNRIAVIDDPISSLSHIYIFNVGQLIKNLYFKSDRFTQVFIFTHSLYFFYELTDTNHERRKATQNLYRIIKNHEGSSVLSMSYDEIQNDYQSYWSIIKDPKQPPALIANCMRNIVEHFFSFVKKKDMNNVFLQPALKGLKYQAFCRYVNRESHSVGQNIFDLKEFDYDIFREGLKCVFQECGYIEHYEQMMKS